MLDGERANHEASPSAAGIDSQSVTVPMAEGRGFEASKMIVGRKRHAAVDADGRLLMTNYLTTADIADSTDSQLILGAIRKRWLAGSSVSSPTEPMIADG